MSLEQNLYQQTEAYILKKHYVILEERLALHGVPLLGWMVHRRKVNEFLDEDGLRKFADAASTIAAPLVNRYVNILPSGRK